MNYDRYDIVVLPFPFRDKLENKRRPVLVLSSGDFNRSSGHLVTAMITTAKKSAWPMDIALADFAAAGLPVPCLVRMKLYTADQKQVIKTLGKLSDRDQKAVRVMVKKLLA